MRLLYKNVRPYSSRELKGRLRDDVSKRIQKLALKAPPFRVIAAMGLSTVALAGCSVKGSEVDAVDTQVEKTKLTETYSALIEDKKLYEVINRENAEIEDLISVGKNFHEEQEIKKRNNVAEYFKARETPKMLGWVPFKDTPDHKAALDCFSKLKETKWQTIASNISFQRDSIKTIDLENGMTIGLVDVEGATKYGQKTKFRALVQLDVCFQFKGISFTDVIQISPASGEVPSISRERGYKRPLYFRRVSSEKPFVVYANPKQNRLMTIRKPNLRKVTFQENSNERGCLFSVLEKGENAAHTALLSELCPNSKNMLKPHYYRYRWSYYGFGKDEIETLKATQNRKKYTYERLINSGIYPTYEGEHISDTRSLSSHTAGSKIPLYNEVDLSIDGLYSARYDSH